MKLCWLYFPLSFSLFLLPSLFLSLSLSLKLSIVVRVHVVDEDEFLR